MSAMGESSRATISRAIMRAIALDCSKTKNPYGEGNSAPPIVEALKALPDPAALLKKHFHEVRVA